MIYLVLLLVLFGLVVFILLFGENPSFRNGIIGKLFSVLTVTIPNFFNRVLLQTVGQTNVNRLSAGWFYCCESKNPFLQIFFVSLSSISILIFLYFAMPHFPGPYLHSVHYVLIPIQILSIYTTYYIACTSDPGIITRKNLKKYLDHHVYDGLIYTPKDCSTCKFQKPARSKHCSLCKACVSKMDHHCAWINGCVGENNQRYFFMFLFTLVEFSAYGAYLCFQIYRGMIIEWGLDKAYMYDSTTGEKMPVSFHKAFLYVLQHDRVIGAIGILGSVVSLVVFVFLVYQIYLAARGITTNEAFKWEMVEDAIDRGELFKEKKVYKRRYKALESSTEEKRVESLEEIDNLYDKGFLENLRQVLFPQSFD